MRHRALAALLVLAVVSCRTGRPAGEPVQPLTATTAEEMLAKLRAERDHFRGMRSLMRVRATVNGKTQSFRAQLAVHDARRMELIAYTPVGTTAFTMKADGDRITTDPPVAPESFAFLRDAGLTPAQVGMVLLGLPPIEEERLDYVQTGLSGVGTGDLLFTFDPPAFPAKKVVITDVDDDDRIEIEHEEVVREN